MPSSGGYQQTGDHHLGPILGGKGRNQGWDGAGTSLCCQRQARGAGWSSERHPALLRMRSQHGPGGKGEYIKAPPQGERLELTRSECS